MGVRDHVEDYYDALRSGAPLAPYFAEHDSLVKFGIHEQLGGYEAVARGLREQTERTTDWAVTSHQLQTGTNDDTGWFSDLVTMEWTDTERDEGYELDTRWSGTVITAEDGWRFVSMHVSVPYAFFEEEHTLDEELIDG